MLKVLKFWGLTSIKLVNATTHINNRVKKTQKSTYGLASSGFSYKGGLYTDVKSYLWKTVCAPTLCYNCEIFSLSTKELSNLEKTQGSCVRQSLGLSKFSHSSDLLDAMNISKIKFQLQSKLICLYKILFLNDSPLKDINMFFLNEFYVNNRLYNGTLISKLVKDGYSPIKCAFAMAKPPKNDFHNSGIVDSLKGLIYSKNFIDPDSNEFRLTCLLTKVT